MTTIRDVAKKAGVAACTVSRVLNDSDRVLPETREKVLCAIKELDYVPDELTRGVFRKKVGIVAMLVPGIRHLFFGSLAHYIEQELYLRGYKLMLCSTNDNARREAEYMRMFRSNLVDGVIMGVNNMDDKVYESFKKPMVMLDYRVNDKIPLIACDNEQGASLAAKVFARRKCKRVIQICDENIKSTESLKRYGRFERDLTAYGIGVCSVTVKWNDFDCIVYQESARKILEENPDMDGVMAADMQACAFLKAALDMEKRVPDDLCVVAFDGTYLTQVNTMRITTIVQPLEQMAQLTVKTLAGLIDKIPAKHSCVLLPTRLVRGDSA